MAQMNIGRVPNPEKSFEKTKPEKEEYEEEEYEEEEGEGEEEE
jgi:hypothetical protein